MRQHKTVYFVAGRQLISFPGMAVAVPVMVVFCLIGLVLPLRLSAANAGISIYVDGSLMEGGDKPRIEQERVLVPLRSVVEYLDGKINWYPDEQQVVGFRGARGFDLIIGATRANLSDGSTYALDVPAQIIGGRTYVPLRFVSEAMGCQVEWDDAARAVRITTTPVDAAKEVEALVNPVLVRITTDKGVGSGFFYAKDGQVLTCAPLVSGASWIKVTTAGGREYQAQVITIDSVIHLAKLRVDRAQGEIFPVFRYFDDFSGVEAGERVFAARGASTAGGAYAAGGASAAGSASAAGGASTAGGASATGGASAAGTTLLSGAIAAKAPEDTLRGGIPTYDLTAAITTALTAEHSGGPLLKANGALLGVLCVHESGEASGAYVIPIEYAFTMRNR